MELREIDRRYAGSRIVAGFVLTLLVGVLVYQRSQHALQSPGTWVRDLLVGAPQIGPAWWAHLSPGADTLAILCAVVAMVAVAWRWFSEWTKERRSDLRARQAQIAALPSVHDRDAARQMARARSYARRRTRG